MTDEFTKALEARVAEVAAIEDPVQRGTVAREVRDQIAAADRSLYAIQREAVQELHQERSWAEVGRLFNRTSSWAEALARGRSAKRKRGHATQPTPSMRAEEGRSPDTTTP